MDKKMKPTSSNVLLNEELYNINRELLFKRYEHKAKSKVSRPKGNNVISRWFIRKGGWMVAMWTLSITLLLYVVFTCFLRQHMVHQQDDNFKEFVRKQAKAKSVNILDTQFRAEISHITDYMASENGGDSANNNDNRIDISGAKLLTTNHSGANSLLDPSCIVQIKDVSNISRFLFRSVTPVTYEAIVIWKGDKVNFTSRIVGLTIRGENMIIESLKLRLNTVIAVDDILDSNLVPYVIEIPGPMHLPQVRFPPKENLKIEGSVENFVFVRNPFLLTNQTKDIPTQLLLMYLTNCALPLPKLRKSLNDTYFMYLYACHMSAPNVHVLYGKAAAQAAMLKTLFLQKENICMIPTRIMDLLRSSDDVASDKLSVGSMLVKRFTDVKTSHVVQNIVTEIAETVDGRIAFVLHWYNLNCENGISELALMTPTRDYLQNEPIKALETMDRHGGSKVMFAATFEDGKHAFVKLFQSCNHDFLGEGAKELLAFYSDRAFGFDIFPNVVVRRIYFKGKDDYKLVSIDNKNFSIPFHMPPDEYESRVRNIFLEKEGDSFYMDLAFIGSIKEFKRFEYDTDELVNVLYKNQSIDPTRGKHMVTLQTVRDITNIVVFDFLTHNFDRKGDNWIRSGLRITPFDSGKAFDDVNVTHSLICERMLQLPELETLSGMFPGVNVGDLDRLVPHSCDAVPVQYRLCKFEKDTVDRIKVHGRNAVSLLKQFLQKENKGHFSCVDPEKYNVYNGIEIRLNYILQYFSECYDRLGEHMYL